MTSAQHSATWRINPFVKRPEYLLAADRAVSGGCPVPEDVEHCHGTEIHHLDGLAECFSERPCEAPAALHLHLHRCAPGMPGGYGHPCRRCR